MEKKDKSKKGNLQEIEFKSDPKADKLGAAPAEVIAEALRTMMKKNPAKDSIKGVAAVFVAFSLCFSFAACKANTVPVEKTGQEASNEKAIIKEHPDYSSMSPEQMVESLSLEQKASQMVQPACYMISPDNMRANDYGSILSKPQAFDYQGWASYVNDFQAAALESDAGIPYIFGQDDVHGVNYCSGAVIFPHNIGLGAADDEDLMYEMGLITADEAKLCHMLWNFSPCVAQSQDPRWGRTYESYGSDLDTIKRLSCAYTKGLQDGGIVACTKHFFADGNVVFGTGENSDVARLIDRGDAQLSDDEINKLLDVYKAQIDAGVKTIMISHSSLNGVKMHENKKYIEMLKKDMGFEGFIVSDWNSIQNTSPSSYYDQVVTSVNAGIDMLMEVERFDEARDIIVEAVQKGDIEESRIDDAVCRILKVKKDIGVFEDPYGEALETKQAATGSDEYREVAQKLVEKSQVLVKNENNVLPLRNGSSVYIMGPAADNDSAQCGGWTLDWNSSPTQEIPGVTSILEGFSDHADEYGIEVITDEAEASKADVILLVVGEQPYAEWNGDAEDIDLCGPLGLDGNKEAIEKAESFGKPVVACIVAGRNVFIDKYADKWDGIVMSYLPGSEGQGVASVICGQAEFTGKLPSPWYSSTDQIGTDKAWIEMGK